jgi:hypothetical protein
VVIMPGSDTGAAGTPDIRVGLGTAAPTSRLEVAGGDMRISGGGTLRGLPTDIAAVQADLDDTQAVSRAYVDAAAGGGPTGWTCRIVSSGPQATISGPSVLMDAQADCAAPEKVVSGGCHYDAGNGYPPASNAAPGPTTLYDGWPIDQGWRCTGAVSTTWWPSATLTAYANCCQ